MKTGRFFWGTFFVVMGLLLLVSNLDYIQVDWSFSWKFWPLILVFWGLSKFTEQRSVKAILATLNGVLLACLVFGFFSFQWFNVTFDDSEPLRFTQHFSEPYDASIERATFQFRAGAGGFTVLSATDNLIDAQTESSFGEYTLDKTQESRTADITLRMKDKRRFRFFERARNQAEIRLNANPTWEMQFDAGACKLDLDLTPYKTESVSVDAGASTVRIRVGDRADATSVHVKTGVSSVRIEIPATSGCEIYDNAHVGSTHFDDFSKVGDRRWQTDNYNSAAKKVNIEIDAGVSTIRVRRY